MSLEHRPARARISVPTASVPEINDFGKAARGSGSRRAREEWLARAALLFSRLGLMRLPSVNATGPEAQDVDQGVLKYIEALTDFPLPKNTSIIA
jgi:hypothetical protein